MRWVVTFLHNDAEAEDVVVDEGTLVEVFEAMIGRDSPAHVIDIELLAEDDGTA